jgi:hypothetical protein
MYVNPHSIPGENPTIILLGKLFWNCMFTRIILVNSTEALTISSCQSIISTDNLIAKGVRPTMTPVVR